MSREGTTQGDVAAMQMYSIATKPMVYENETNTKKSFYADNRAGAGTLETVHEWWTFLLAPGPKYGYSPNASKTILLVKSEHYERALQIFAWSGVNVTTDATKYLGERDMWSTNERKSWQTDNPPGKAKRTGQARAACSL